MNNSLFGSNECSTRRLHVLDVENLVGGPRASAEDFQGMWEVYSKHAVPVRPGDHVIAASSSFTAHTAVFALAGAGIQWRIRDGADGADLALLEAIDIDHAARRFGTIMIASGDHIFVPLAIAARERGMAVHQVIGCGTPARSLMAACPTRTRMKLGPPSALTVRRDLKLAA